MTDGYTVEDYEVTWSNVRAGSAFDTLQAAIDGAVAGDTITVAAGEYAGPVVVNKPLTILAEPGATLTGGVAQTALTIAANDVTIDGLTIEGPLTQPHYENGWGTGQEAVGIGLSGARTGIVLTDNTIQDVRTGVYVTPNSSVEATGNTIENTKGAFILYSHLADMSDNDTGPLGNEWDIVVLLSSQPAAYFGDPSVVTEVNYGAAVMALSGANNDMTVLDRRFGSNGFIDGYETIGNRSHIIVDATSTAGAAEDFNLGNGLGNPRQPLGSLSTAVGGLVNGGDLEVRTGTYVGNVTFDAPMTLRAVGEPHVQGLVTITSPGFTFSGFEVTNPTGTLGLSVRASGVTVSDNVFQDIGTSTTGGVSAIYVQTTQADTDDVVISDNLITNIGHTGTNASHKGIFVGDSTSNHVVSGLRITDNVISDIHANDNQFSAGGRGVNGIQVNAGYSTSPLHAGYVTGMVIADNHISNLSGHWVHAIGLEAPTPDAQVTGNTITDLRASKRANETVPADFDDEAGVFFEGNPDAGSVVVTQNAFSDMVYGVAIHPAMTGFADLIDATRNWWGPDGPSGMRLGTEDALTAPFTYAPWLSSPGGSDVFETGTIAGRVVDGNGTAVAGVTISIDGTGDATAVTGSDGRYSVSRTAGTYTVTMTVPDNSVASGPTSRVVIVADSGTATADFVVLTQGSIVGHVRDAAGTGVESATVTLRQDGTVVATDTTDAAGAYAFPGEDAGTYTVTVTVPSGYTAGGPVTRTVNLASGSSATADFTLARTASISGRVVDTAGVARPGVTVTLSGAGTGTAATGADGRYQFTGRTQFGVYTVTIAPPSGYTAGGPVSRSVNLASGSSATADFVVAREAAITGQVLDSTGTGVAGITVSIARSGSAAVTRTTDGQGRYQVENLTDFGAYTVTMTVPSGFVATGATSRAVNLAAGSSATADFAVVQVASISGRVLDGAGDPVAGVPIALTGAGTGSGVTDLEGRYQFAGRSQFGAYTVAITLPTGFAAGGPTTRTVNLVSGSSATADFRILEEASISGQVVDGTGAPVSGVSVAVSGPSSGTLTTDGEGRFRLANRTAFGAYTVAITVPTGFAAGGPVTRTVNLAEGSSATADFRVLETASVSGQVTDVTGAGLSGVQVTITPPSGSASTLTTDGQGRYRLAGLGTFGAYTVSVGLPTGFAAGGVTTRSVNLANGSSATANFVLAATASITGQVVDSTGSGVAGVQVAITRGTTTANLVTDAQGRYRVANLSSFGAYTVTMTVPSGFVANGPTARAVNLASGSSASADFGLVQVASISGRVVDGAGEPVAGVAVALSGAGTAPAAVTDTDGRYRFTGRTQFGAYTVAITVPTGFAAGGPVNRTVNLAAGSSATADFRILEEASVSGQVLDGSGAPVAGVTVTVGGPSSATLTTDGQGRYRLANRTQFGAYSVVITVPTGFAAGGAITRTVNLAEGSSATADFRLIETAAVAGQVTDATGAGLSGVQVALSGGVTVATDGQGRYRFANLTPGSFTVTVTVPTGFAAGGVTARTVNLASGSSASADFTLAAVASIAGQVLDAAGAPVAGVTVSLSGAGTGTTQTDASGNYRFANRSQFGRYDVTITVPTGFTANGPTARIVNLASGQAATASFALTQTGTISGQVVDNTLTGVSGVEVALDAGTPVLTDAEGRYRFTGLPVGESRVVTVTVPDGFEAVDDANTATTTVGDIFDVVLLPLGTVSGYLFIDIDGDNERDAGEPPLAGVRVDLMVDGSSVDNTVTAADGFYLFTGTPGDATIRVDLDGYVQPTALFTESSFRSFSMAFSAGDFTLASSHDTTTSREDVGLLPAGTIVGTVRTSGGDSVAGVAVALSGHASRSTTTSSDGAFSFLGLPNGSAGHDYTLSITAPSGFTLQGAGTTAVSLAVTTAASRSFTLAAAAAAPGDDEDDDEVVPDRPDDTPVALNPDRPTLTTTPRDTNATWRDSNGTTRLSLDLTGARSRSGTTDPVFDAVRIAAPESPGSAVAALGREGIRSAGMAGATEAIRLTVTGVDFDGGFVCPTDLAPGQRIVAFDGKNLLGRDITTTVGGQTCGRLDAADGDVVIDLLVVDLDAPSFGDVGQTSPHFLAVEALAADSRAILRGTAEGDFDAGGSLRRDQAASILARALGLDLGDADGGFADVPASGTHAAAIAALMELDPPVITGFSDGTFRPGSLITRDQLASIVVRAYRDQLEAPSGEGFPDVRSDSVHADAIDRLINSGAIAGFTDGTFGSGRDISRAQVASVVARSLYRITD
ncbi:MAG TPA: carboxypeptidase regulatory-like domain-containing protein [Egicoccus sp.]|nr:carboxypeptidase regulatory-like domain-containing protein [Egicoccus sp.]HSK22153.1 carboxypeptidase regulatory-like domain-containing protein [Egicoccus sp.]